MKEKIKEEARIHANLKKDFDMEEELYYNSTGMSAYESFQEGALSEVAKEYHTKTMYYQDEVIELIKLALYNVNTEIEIYTYPDGMVQFINLKDLEKWFQKHIKLPAEDKQ